VQLAHYTTSRFAPCYVETLQCLRHDDADCRLLPACRVEGILRQSTQQFLDSLDGTRALVRNGHKGT
jgi:hypothetical protein